MAEIELRDVTKRYPDGTEAVKSMTLGIEDGEFMILVGPSGCGKSTALRMIAGLEEITDGQLLIDGDVVNELSPKERDVAMVFQNYALYPHMSVSGNMAFALKLAGVDKAEIRKRVEEAARVLDLTEHLDRKPAQLSGGQRQRVAMGRAIVRNPAAFLMDEPLSNLDAKLRGQMRIEVSRLQRRLGTTTVYVTHDQTEAMTLGDRVAVMRGGVLQQVATPQELYNNPENLFVAGFIGSPPMNFLRAHLDDHTLKLPMADIPVTDEIHARCARSADNLIAGIRPEHLEDASLVGDRRDKGVTFRAKVDVVESLGADLYAYAPLPEHELEVAELRELAEDAGAAELPGAGETNQIVARLDPASRVTAGAEIELWLDVSRMHFFAPEGGRCLAGDDLAASSAAASAS